uniref:Uncharacterized protein n=1 Tax=Arundo donax TaxID=35708 RepID=A0A0A8YJ49_ARUDO
MQSWESCNHSINPRYHTIPVYHPNTPPIHPQNSQ